MSATCWSTPASISRPCRDDPALANSVPLDAAAAAPGPAAVVAVAAPARLAALSPQPARLLEPDRLCRAVRAEHVRRGAVERPAAGGQVPRRVVFPDRADLCRDHVRRRLPDPDRLSRSLHPPAHHQQRQLGHLSAQPLFVRHAELLRQGAQSGAAVVGELARHRRPRPRRAGAADLRLPRVGAVRPGADRDRRGDRHHHRRADGLLRRALRPDLATRDRDLELDARALSADHLRLDLRAQPGAADHPAVAVRLDGLVRLCARRVLPQPLA